MIRKRSESIEIKDHFAYVPIVDLNDLQLKLTNSSAVNKPLDVFRFESPHSSHSQLIKARISNISITFSHTDTLFLVGKWGKS